MKKIIFLFVLCLSFLSICSCAKVNNENDMTADALVTVSHNSKVGLFLNRAGKVIDVISMNDDADILTSDLDLTGQDVEDAVEEIIDESVQAGLIDENTEGQDVEVSVDVEDEAKQKDYLDRIINKINRYFNKHGIDGQAVIDNLEEYVEKAQALNINKRLFKMMMTVLALDSDKTFEDVCAMSIDELVKICHEYVKDHHFNHETNSLFKDEKEALKEKYAEIKVLCDEIKALVASLDNEALTEEEIALINAEIAEKEAKVKELKEAYHLELDALKEEYKNFGHQNKENHKKEKEEKVNQKHNECGGFGHKGK